MVHIENIKMFSDEALQELRCIAISKFRENSFSETPINKEDIVKLMPEDSLLRKEEKALKKNLEEKLESGNISANELLATMERVQNSLGNVFYESMNIVSSEFAQSSKRKH